MAPSQRPIRVPLPQRLADFRERYLPVVVWTVCAVLVGTMLLQRVRRFEYIGLAQALEYEISAEANGTLETVVVDLFEPVNAGDVVAKLDDRALLASLSTTQASIRQLTAELDAEATRLSRYDRGGVAGWEADLRRFQIDEEARRLDTFELRVQIQTDQVELERLALEKRRAEPLLDGGLLSRNEYDLARLAHEQVRRRLEENRVLLAEMEEKYRAAGERRRQYEERRPDGQHEARLLAPLREAIQVEARRLDEIELRRQALILRSPVAGQVSQILCRRGQSVVAGEPILTIAEKSVTEIVAYLGESEPVRVRENMPVLIASRERSGAIAESFVLRVAPTVQALPTRLWRDPGVADYGRAVVIAAAPSMNLVPGEAVDVKFLSD